VKLALRLRNLYLLRAEIRIAPTESQRLVVLTVLIGALCGLAAVGFHLAIRMIEAGLSVDSATPHGVWWIGRTLLTPALGAIVAGLLLQFAAPSARGSGITQVKVAFANRGAVRLRDSVWKFVICAIQIGSGSSLGREGPTVHICAGVAGAMRHVPGVSPRNLRRLMPVGAAAGIAAAFNAPIAAVTFTIEEVVGKLDQAVLSGVIIAAAVAAVIERSVLGEHPVFGDIPRTYGFHHPSSLVTYTFLGLAAAVVSVVFHDSLLRLRGRFQRSSLPAWVGPGIGGLVTGGLALFALGLLETRGVTGGGYETLIETLGGHVGVRLMLALCALKIAATVASYSSGGAGGIFAPSLFIGATLGGAFGALDNWLFGHHEPVGAFALVGMGAVFAGVIRAPITSVLIIIEMTSGYSLILPLMLANMTAFVVAHAWRPIAIYEALLEQDGIHLPQAGGALDDLPIAHLVRHDGPAMRAFSLGAAADEVGRVTTETKQEVYPVLDGDGRILGLITREELGILSSEPELAALVNAADLMRPPASARLDDDLRTALETMIAYGTKQLPVTDSQGRCVGLLHEADIVRAYVGATAVASRSGATSLPGDLTENVRSRG
jgi:CIC family chloride channel protein